MTNTSKLQSLVEQYASGCYEQLISKFGEVTLECSVLQYKKLLLILKETEELHFEQVIDLCGVDYLNYANKEIKEKRFAVVSHLLSYKNNYRIRVRVFAEEGDFPVVDSIVDIYNGVDWYEREAFDMYGILFKKHPDLRRLLSDYGFVGHPLRKDFPISGHVEMIYDEKEGRVVYQPVTIEPRNNVPRIVREDFYGA